MFFSAALLIAALPFTMAQSTGQAPICKLSIEADKIRTISI